MSHDSSNEPDNKQLVLDFVDIAFVQRKPAEAAERYLGPRYTQHNPTASDGAEAFIGLVGGIFAQAPEASLQVKRAVAEENLVVVHSHMTMFPGDPGQAVVDIFRVEDGRIVEHWDVMQPVPAESANTNGMF